MNDVINPFWADSVVTSKHTEAGYLEAWIDGVNIKCKLVFRFRINCFCLSVDIYFNIQTPRSFDVVKEDDDSFSTEPQISELNAVCVTAVLQRCVLWQKVVQRIQLSTKFVSLVTKQTLRQA
jgi:hypothetical protein